MNLKETENHWTNCRYLCQIYWCRWKKNFSEKFIIFPSDNFLRKWLFGGTVPPGKKIIWRYRTSGEKNYLEVPQNKCLVISWEFPDTFFGIDGSFLYRINVGHYRIFNNFFLIICWNFYWCKGKIKFENFHQVLC